MRATFAPVDDVLIERVFQPVADLLTNRTRISRGAAACCCLDVASISWIASRAGGMATSVAQANVVSAAVEFSLLMLGLVALVSLRTIFRRAGGRQANPLRLAMRPHRAVALLMLVARLFQLQSPGVADAADLAMLVFAASALYLGACAERPPVLRRWVALVPAG